MPLLSITTSAYPLPADRRVALFTRLTGVLARELGKPEAYVMVALSPRVDISFGGDSARPSCYAELKNIGTLDAARIAQLSGVLCGELAAALEIAQDRIYIEFTNADGALWGWNGETFA
jgi:phenylpyruvate tautomerase